MHAGETMHCKPCYKDILCTLSCVSVAAHRLDQGVDGDCPVTMTLPDLCYIVEPLVECDLPTFSVEIKVRAQEINRYGAFVSMA